MMHAIVESMRARLQWMKYCNYVIIFLFKSEISFQQFDFQDIICILCQNILKLKYKNMKKMFDVQYALGNRHDLCEMFDIFLAKSVQFKYKTMYSTDFLFIDLILHF